MPGGRYDGSKGAQGLPGGQALFAALDALAATGNVKDTRAQLTYLMKVRGGYEAMGAAGVHARRASQIQQWLEGEVKPNAGNQAAISRAYTEVRAKNRAPYLKARLTADGGAQVEVYPVNQNRAGTAARHLDMRRMSPGPRTWERFIDMWEEGDYDGADDLWDQVVDDELGSDGAAYSWVSSVGLA